jgi:prophage DNA circulation protein
VYKNEAEEAAPILQRSLYKLLGALPAIGKPEQTITRANFRTACGHLILNALPFLQQDIAGPPLDRCFALAVDSGIELLGLRYVRNQAYAEVPVTAGAKMVRSAIVYASMAHAASVLAGMTFTSREQVEQMKKVINEAQNRAEEEAADDMAQESYQRLVQFHAAVIFYLTETARPLPRMLQWRFSKVMSTLMLAQRLYYDASRADELREENHIIHPAFSKLSGRALSS